MQRSILIAIIVLFSASGLSCSRRVGELPRENWHGVDLVNLSEVSPSEFLLALRQETRAVPVFSAPGDWLNAQSIRPVIDYVDSTVECGFVYNTWSSDRSPDSTRSTLGIQARYLILGFLRGRYPSGFSNSHIPLATQDERVIKSFLMGYRVGRVDSSIQRSRLGTEGEKLIELKGNLTTDSYNTFTPYELLSYLRYTAGDNRVEPPPPGWFNDLTVSELLPFLDSVLESRSSVTENSPFGSHSTVGDEARRMVREYVSQADGLRYQHSPRDEILVNAFIAGARVGMGREP